MITPDFKVTVSRDQYARLLMRERDQRAAIKEVVKFVESVGLIIGPYKLAETNKVSLVVKIPSIIDEFKKNGDMFATMLSEDFLNKLKTLSADEISGN
jgi:hypothetical protein